MENDRVVFFVLALHFHFWPEQMWFPVTAAGRDTFFWSFLPARFTISLRRKIKHPVLI